MKRIYNYPQTVIKMFQWGKYAMLFGFLVSFWSLLIFWPDIKKLTKIRPTTNIQNKTQHIGPYSDALAKNFTTLSKNKR